MKKLKKLVEYLIKKKKKKHLGKKVPRDCQAIKVGQFIHVSTAVSKEK